MVDTAAKVYYIVYKHCEKQMNNSRKKMSLQVRARSRNMDKRNPARCDEMEPKNRFSTLLEHLMSVAALKHYVVAQALQYDVSYISKWIGGKALPAEKSAEDVLRRLSRCLV